MAVAAWQSEGAAGGPDALVRELAAAKPRPAIYWADFVGSALLGWSAFAVAGSLWGSGVAWLAFGVAVLALYRAVLFIHELTHLAKGAVPGFHTGWDLLAGFPLLAPSLMYVGSHGEHHKTDFYGTADDPEYAPIAHWSHARLAGSTLLMLLLPVAFVLRWGLLGPLGFVIPAVRRFATARLSTLAINPAYLRREPRGVMARRWRIEEACCALVVWGAALGLASGAIAPRWALLWYALLAAILLVNHVRTLAAHRYENEGAPMSDAAQLADSINLWGPAWLRPLTALFAPVGLRFHALHHLMPRVPYHGLGALHRALTRDPAGDATYRNTCVGSLSAALASLWVRTRAAS
jgi:fatty acid desaturase